MLQNARRAVKPAKYRLWCLILFTWLIAALSICLILSIFSSSLTVIPCFHISLIVSLLHCSFTHVSHLSSDPPIYIYPYISLHLYVFLHIFHISSFPSFYHCVISFPYLSSSFCNPPTHPLYFNSYISASTSLSFLYTCLFLMFLIVLSHSVFSAAGIVRKKQWCEMVPCLEDEGCDLLVNKSGWTCTQPGGRVKTTTVSSDSPLATPPPPRGYTNLSQNSKCVQKCVYLPHKWQWEQHDRKWSIWKSIVV